MEERADFASSLLERIDRDRATLVSLARLAVDGSSRLSELLGDQDLDQLVNAFERILIDALDGRPAETRQLVIESTVPAFVDAGLTLESFVEVTTTFSVLLTELVADLPEPVRREARVWLATFMGEYAREIVTFIGRLENR